MSSRFCIVHFMEENTVEVVPDFWICTSMDTCCWPNTTFPKKNVVRRTLPNKHWKIYKCRVLSTFAQSNLKDAEISSDFPSKNVKSLGKRLSKRNRKYYSNSNSSDETESCTKKKATFLHNASKPNFTSTSATSNSSNDEEEKENTLPKKPNVQLPKAFAVTNEKVVNANCEAPRKKITFSATKSPQNYRNSVIDDAQPGCSKNMYQEEQRIISSIPRKETLLTTSNYIGESEFEKLVIRDLIKIKFDVKEIRDVLVPIVQDILNNPQENFRERNIRHARQEEELENILPTFPFTIMQDWYDLETLLSNNTVACEQLEKMFSTRGGKDGNDMIRRILGAVFSPQLSAMISWQGRKNNIKLQGTIVARTIFVIVKKKFKMDDRQIELTVINWFRRSSERIKKNPEINNAD
ncbi:uncharacterized protein LOC113004852 isoform X3 [Solenopsis invicta]|uniref:uncharacterized protein LOC113004852 isoform X3 n=1 Tax=Solenopsis invicta TaxID=13686 RepID=UPI00193EA161|nr:uncharacterized protein LOC113004852 isoform X3 [Solenopsis invicta]